MEEKLEIMHKKRMEGVCKSQEVRGVGNMDIEIVSWVAAEREATRSVLREIAITEKRVDISHCIDVHRAT